MMTPTCIDDAAFRRLGAALPFVLLSLAAEGAEFQEMPVRARALVPARIVEDVGASVKIDAGVVSNPAERRKERRKPVPPAKAAVPTRGGVRVTDIGASPLSEMSEPWLLFWFGGVIEDYLPACGETGFHRRVMKAGNVRTDAPHLVVLARRPRALKASPGGLEVMFPAKGDFVAWMPLCGRRPVPADETAKWSAGLPGEVAERCRRWAGLLLNRPAGVKESFKCEANGDLVLEQSFRFKPVENDWRLRGRAHAPVPPVLGLLAKWGGYGARFSEDPEDLGFATAWGPFTAVPGESYRVKLPGILKYVWEAREVEGTGAAAGDLRKRLADEVRKMSEAGKLAPLRLHFGEARATYFFATPWEVFGPLAEVAAALEGRDRDATLALIGREYAAHPPDDGRKDRGFGSGARREFERHAAELADERGRMQVPRLHRMAAVEAYLRATGDEAALQEFKKLAGSAAGDVRNMEWRSWQFVIKHSTSCNPESRDRYWDQNTATAGLIAAARLFERSGRRGHAELFAAAAAKSLLGGSTMPVLLGAYYDGRGRDEFMRAASSGGTSGLYVTTSVDENRPMTLTSYWGDHRYYLSLNVTPEIGRLWADLSPGGGRAREVLLELMAWAPGWYVADGEPWFHIAEISRQPMDCAWGLFKAEAFVLGADAATLRRHVDVPLCRAGDLYYMEKLALAVQAHGRVRWRDVRR